MRSHTSDKDNYEMPIANLVNDEEVALPHAEPAQINDDIITVDAKVCLIRACLHKKKRVL